MKKFNILPDKIIEVIGPQGKMINSIIDECNKEVNINIQDDGQEIDYSVDSSMIDKAYDLIMNIVGLPQVGDNYIGEVVRIEQYGAFIRLYGTTDALCHISKLDWKRVDKVEDVCKLGDKLKVIISSIDAQGKIDVAQREFLDKPADYIEKVESRNKPFNKKKKF